MKCRIEICEGEVFALIDPGTDFLMTFGFCKPHWRDFERAHYLMRLKQGFIHSITEGGKRAIGGM